MKLWTKWKKLEELSYKEIAAATGEKVEVEAKPFLIAQAEGCFNQAIKIALVSRHGLLLQSRSYTGKVVITMPHSVILKYVLARERCIGVERDRSGLVEIRVA